MVHPGARIVIFYAFSAFQQISATATKQRPAKSRPEKGKNRRWTKYIKEKKREKLICIGYIRLKGEEAVPVCVCVW